MDGNHEPYEGIIEPTRAFRQPHAVPGARLRLERRLRYHRRMQAHFARLALYIAASKRRGVLR